MAKAAINCKKYTHPEMVDIAERWLTNQCHCHAVLTELNLAWNPEIPDAIGWTMYGKSLLIEVKASRSDFLDDKKKSFRRRASKGVGDYRYFMTPKSMLKPEDLTSEVDGKKVWNGWGLLEVSGNGVHVTTKSHIFEKKNSAIELALLVGALRRVQTRVKEPLATFIKGWASKEAPEYNLPTVDEGLKLGLDWLLENNVEA
jgi:hypothetical protein